MTIRTLAARIVFALAILGLAVATTGCPESSCDDITNPLCR